MPRRIFGLDEENLRKLYINEQWSTLRIAKFLKCGDETIRQRLIKYNIPIRSKSEALKLRILTPEHRAKLMKQMSKLHSIQIGENHPKWKNGRYKDSYGYSLLRINKQTVKEHRYVIEKDLGRPLLPWEEVHHINGNKQDNRLENLEVFISEHKHKDWLRVHSE